MSDTSIQNVLNERGNRYGKFEDNSELTFELFNAVKSKIEAHPKSTQLALFMILHKVSRIVNGDPMYLDNWVDIQGYAKLVVDEIQSKTNTEKNIADYIEQYQEKFDSFDKWNRNSYREIPKYTLQPASPTLRPQCVEAKSARTLLDSFVQHSNTLCQNGSEC